MDRKSLAAVIVMAVSGVALWGCGDSDSVDGDGQNELPDIQYSSPVAVSHGKNDTPVKKPQSAGPADLKKSPDSAGAPAKPGNTLTDDSGAAGALKDTIEAEKRKAEESAKALNEQIGAEKKKTEEAARNLNEQLEAEKKKAEAAAKSLNEQLEAEKEKAEAAANTLKKQLPGQKQEP